MLSAPIQETWFDDATVKTMGEAFDQACLSLPLLATAILYEFIARRIVEAAKNGERDLARLSELAMRDFSVEDVSMLSVGRHPRRPVYTTVAHAA